MTIKKQSARVLAAFLLLMTFVTGQLIVIAHTHKTSYESHQTKKTNDEACKICAQNGHLQLFYQQQQNLFTLTLTAVNVYREYSPVHYSVVTRHSSNRGPPAC